MSEHDYLQGELTYRHAEYTEEEEEKEAEEEEEGTKWRRRVLSGGG